MKKVVLGILPFCFLPIIIIVMLGGIFASDNDVSGDTVFVPPTEQGKFALKLWKYVEGKGGTMEFASGWLGNIEAESGVNPSIVQGGVAFDLSVAKSNVGGYGIGLVQLDADRRQAYINKAEKDNKVWSDFDYQIDYLWNDDGTDSKTLQSWKERTDVDEITVDVLIHYERAGDTGSVAQNYRKTCARAWYSFLKSGGTGIAGGNIQSLEEVIGRSVGTNASNTGQCYGLASYYAQKIGFGVLHGGMYASKIGDDYNWAGAGFTVIKNPKITDIKPGDILCTSGLSEYGHVVIVSGVDVAKGTYTCYQQNYMGNQTVIHNSMNWMSAVAYSTIGKR